MTSLALLIAVALLSGLVVGVNLDRRLSARSNFLFLSYKGSSEPLCVILEDGDVKPVEELTLVELKNAAIPIFRGESASAWSIPIKRKPKGRRQLLAELLLSPEIHVFEFDPGAFSFDVVSRRGTDKKFLPLTIQQVRKGKPLGFAINASYFDPDGQPLGLIIRDGEKLSTEYPAWSGFFFVKNGIPWFGPRSLFEETEGDASLVVQGYPSVMKNHEVFYYMNKQPDRFFNGSELTFRSLGGVRDDGTVVFVVSGQGGIMSMAEVTEIAHLWGVKHATLLDGGKSLQYEFDFGGETVSFQSFNNSWELEGRLSPERPPVFLEILEKK